MFSIYYSLDAKVVVSHTKVLMFIPKWMFRVNDSLHCYSQFVQVWFHIYWLTSGKGVRVVLSELEVFTVLLSSILLLCGHPHSHPCDYPFLLNKVLPFPGSTGLGEHESFNWPHPRHISTFLSLQIRPPVFRKSSFRYLCRHRHSTVL